MCKLHNLAHPHTERYLNPRLSKITALIHIDMYVQKQILAKAHDRVNWRTEKM